MAPCDVISKIKQNSSDMNEIILAPCDAGYVKSCTGSLQYYEVLCYSGAKHYSILAETFISLSKIPR
jgi:hypothetical protein